MTDIHLLCGCTHDGTRWIYCESDRPRTVVEELQALALSAGLPPLEEKA